MDVAGLAGFEVPPEGTEQLPRIRMLNRVITVR
jgi:hypothetical protein